MSWYKHVNGAAKEVMILLWFATTHDHTTFPALENGWRIQWEKDHECMWSSLLLHRVTQI